MAAMSFLELVNRTRRECGVSSSEPVTLQTGLTTEQTRFKDWVNDAWIDVQVSRDDWLWMRGTVQFDTVAGTYNYTPASAGVTNLGDWRRKSFRCWITAQGAPTEQILPFMEYDTWRNVYQFANMRTTQWRPAVFTVMPDRSLSTGPLPDAAYTIYGEYHRAPVSLSADADSPSGSVNGMPERYQMLVVYKAMKAYGMFAAAAEVVERATREESRLMKQLIVFSLPTITSGPPLA